MSEDQVWKIISFFHSTTEQHEIFPDFHAGKLFSIHFRTPLGLVSKAQTCGR